MPDASWCAGSNHASGIGRVIVAYETAMERTFDKLEDSAAPIVPEDSAKAAGAGAVVRPEARGCGGAVTHLSCCVRGWDPRSGQVPVSLATARGRQAERTSRSICPGYKLCSAMLAHVAGVWAAT